MHRFPYLSRELGEELLDAGLAMLDGSYWTVELEESAPDYESNGNFFTGE